MFEKILEMERKIKVFDESLCLEMLEQIQVVDGKEKIVITLLDGTSMECQYE